MENIKSRIAALRAFAGRQPHGVGIVTLLPDGTWSAYRHGRPARIFNTKEAARSALNDCDAVIIIDL